MSEKQGEPRPNRRRDVPSGLWMRCSGCSKMIYRNLVVERGNVCPECSFHFPISSDERIRLLCDPETFDEQFKELAPADPLQFEARRTYRERLDETQKKTGLLDACLVGLAEIGEVPVVFGVSDSRFLMGSMGSVVGEKIARGIEMAREQNRPFIFVSGSGGGARMDEGMFSLMQMAKTSAAIQRLHEAGGLFVSILTNPTMGGVAASFASLGDVVLAEPKALIGFAGPRVVKSTVNIELPEDFQTSEFLLEHGFVDRIVERKNMRTEIARIIDYCGK